MSARTAPLVVPLDRVPGLNAMAVGLAMGAPEVRAFLPDPTDLSAIERRARALGGEPVVMTGQQAGLFTGPLLTLVKAVAARKLAAELSGVGVPARAVFWCASEDHDLVEVTRLAVPERDGVREMGPDADLLAGNRRPVGVLPIEADVSSYLDAVAAADGALADPELIATLRDLHEGRTFFGAFAACLRFLLRDPELPVVDAADRAAKPLLVPLALRIVRERRELRAILAEREALLQAHGHPLQVKGDPQALPLFARVGEERLLLREVEGRFSLKGDAEERTFREDEVVARFESGEWLPSFSALTRPLAASVLMRVAATVLGPAEVAYWAQMHPLFDWAGILPPVVLLRPMVSLVDPVSRRLLDTAGLAIEDVLQGPEALLERRGRERGGAALAALEAAAREMETRLTALEPALVEIDPGLKRPLDATRQNVSFAAGKLREKVTAAAGRADEALAKKIARLSALLLPNGTLAERVYTPVPYLLRLGRDGLLSALEGSLRWDRPGLFVAEPEGGEP